MIKVAEANLLVMLYKLERFWKHSKKLELMICTTIEQSKKLMELGIDRKSSDMYYWCGSDLRLGGYKAQDEEFDIPAWSLSALMDVLPDEVGDNHYLTLDKEGEEYCCSYEDCNGNSFRHCFSDNPIDACVAMIEKLNELKML
jgi:hypothetical protein